MAKQLIAAWALLLCTGHESPPQSVRQVTWGSMPICTPNSNDEVWRGHYDIGYLLQQDMPLEQALPHVCLISTMAGAEAEPLQDAKQETSVGSSEDVSVYKLQCWHYIQHWPTIRRRMKKRNSASFAVAWDPANGNFDGDCLFAALTFVTLEAIPTRCQMNRTRLAIKRWYESNTTVLDKVAEYEQKLPSEYIADFVIRGWGGLPEAYVHSKITGLGHRVVDRQGRTLCTFPGQQTEYILCYENNHYFVLRGRRRGLPRHPGLLRRLPVGVGCPLSSSRTARVAFEKRYKAQVRPPPPCPDDRPPLERRKGSQDTEAVQDQRSDLVQQKEQKDVTSDQVPDVATALNHARPKAKTCSQQRAHDHMAVHYYDYSTTPLTGRRSPGDLQVAAMAKAESKRLDAMISGKFPIRKMQYVDPAAISSPLGEEHDKDEKDEQMKLDPEAQLNRPYLDQQVEGLFCQLCLRWSDRWHLTSQTHLKRSRWFHSLGKPEQEAALTSAQEVAEVFWRMKADKAGYRGGGSGQDLTSIRGPSSTTAQDVVQSQGVQEDKRSESSRQGCDSGRGDSRGTGCDMRAFGKGARRLPGGSWRR